MRWLLLLLMPVVAMAEPLVIYGDDNFPPYSYSEQGQLRGIYPTLVSAVLARMPEFDTRLAPVPYKRGLRQLQEGQIFALLPPYLRPQERPWMSYSAPLLNERTLAFCRTALQPQPRQWPDDFRQLRLIQNLGFKTVRSTTHILPSELQVSEAAGNREAVITTLSGQADCYINDERAIVWTLTQLQRQGLLADPQQLQPMAVVADEAAHLGFNADGQRFPDQAAFIARFNLELAALKASGEWRRLSEQALAAARWYAPASD